MEVGYVQILTSLLKNTFLPQFPFMKVVNWPSSPFTSPTPLYNDKSLTLNKGMLLFGVFSQW